MRRKCIEVPEIEPIKKKARNNVYDNSYCGKILTDILQRQWKVGKRIGIGGFGEIYLASNKIKEGVKSDAQFVVKIEKHNSGPLFVEINCYLRCARLNMLKEWMYEKNIAEIGMPHYIASGSFKVSSDRYRFLILPRYGQDLESIFLSRNKKFSLKTVFTISIQILDVLEYLHSKGFVHSDIKASNLLLGYSDLGKKKMNPNSLKNIMVRHKRNNEIGDFDELHRKQCVNQIYLLDYGLASRFCKSDGQHHEYSLDERKAHAGTVLFCSRDAHSGCTSRRSDLEVLGFNVLSWLGGQLPWCDPNLEPTAVQQIKITAMDNLSTFLKETFGRKHYPHCIYEYLNYVNNLKFQEEPDYEYCRKVFCRGLIEYGYKNDNVLDFDKVNCDKEIVKGFKENLYPKNLRPPVVDLNALRQPLGSNLHIARQKPQLRSDQRKGRRKKFNWAEVIWSDPEDILRQNNRIGKLLEVGGDQRRQRRTTETSDPADVVLNLDVDSMNPTPAMTEVLNRVRKKNMGIMDQKCDKYWSVIDKHEGYTEAMKLVLYRKQMSKIEEKLKTIKEKRITKPNKNKTPTICNSRRVLRSRTQDIHTRKNSRHV